MARTKAAYRRNRAVFAVVDNRFWTIKQIRRELQRREEGLTSEQIRGALRDLVRSGKVARSEGAVGGAHEYTRGERRRV